MNRRIIVPASMLALAAILVVGLLTAPSTPEDRVAELGARIRCPVCQNEAVIDSPSETARQMLAIIEEKVAAGESDRQIERFFIERYGDWVLLDPPMDGRFLLLWGLPLAALGLGAFAIARRRRSARADREGAGGLDVRRHALADIEELRAQVQEGEIPPEVAEGLEERYRIEAETAEPETDPRTTLSSRTRPQQQARSRARLVVGWLIGILAMVVAVVMATQAAEQDEPAAAARDLSQVSNQELEGVVAENPEVVGMRMALADRYFDTGEWRRALEHYLEVLKRDYGEPDAWARAGWCVYQLGEPDLAAGYVERSLTISPDDPETTLYLGMIRLYGQEDAEAALPLLQQIEARNDVPSDIRARVEEAIVDAERGIAEGGEG